jgi:hypothetical protein
VQSEMALRPRELIRLLYSSEKKSMGIAETGPPPVRPPTPGRAVPRVTFGQTQRGEPARVILLRWSSLSC